MGKKGGKGKDKKGKNGKKGKARRSTKVQMAEPKEVQVPPTIEIKAPVIHCTQKTVTLRPNSYPGLLKHPKNMAVVGSQSGTYHSLCKLIHAAFRCADRIYIMVPWGNYVIFRWHNGTIMTYYLFDGCTCNVNRFRCMDLTCGTAGLLYFEDMHRVINYLIMSRERRV